MTKYRPALRRALDMLPRYDSGDVYKPRWKMNGKKCMINMTLLPARMEKLIRRIMATIDERHYEPDIEFVDVENEHIEVLHRCLRVKTLDYLYKNNFKFNDWAPGKLPIYLRFRGHLIIWNGTHRMTMGVLAGKKIRARVFDFVKFQKWCKTHPKDWDATVINFGASKPRARIIKVKAKHRGNRK